MLKNLPQVDATWSYMLLKMTNFWHTIAQIFMFKPVLLHYTKLLAENLLYKLCFSNFSQKCLLRVEKHAFVKVKLREILVKWFDGKNSPWSLFTVLFHTVLKKLLNSWFDKKKKILWERISRFSTLCNAQCGNYKNSLTFFCKNFVKATHHLQNQLSNTWFDKIFLRWEQIFGNRKVKLQWCKTCINT